MLEFSRVDTGTTPPGVRVGRQYNAAHDFIDRHLAEGRGDKTAIIDDRGRYTYAELAERVNRAGNALRDLGLEPEQRVMMCMLDSVDFVAVFWGAIKIGAVPVPVNTLLTSSDYDFMLRDSRAKVLAVSAPLLEKFEPILEGKPHLAEVVVAGGEKNGGHTALDTLLSGADRHLEPEVMSTDDAAFWLYSSGSTGQPKGAVHLQTDALYTVALYAMGVVGITKDDIVFSAAKLFFAYGLGNAMTFPLYVGATAVLMAERPTPESVMQRLATHRPSIFYGVPTLYAAMLADPKLKGLAGDHGLKSCVSAGEALPEEIGRRWEEMFGVSILDGIGSTEMLHIFLSNRPGDVRYGTTGRPVPGYELKIVDEEGGELGDGELGELLVKGPTSAVCYWNKRAKSLETFQGPWTRTGDKYMRDADGYYTYAGRSDDMLKVGGIWVSPFEVESALMGHDDVLEAAVVGEEDASGLVKPHAYVVLHGEREPSADLESELKGFVKGRLAPYKYPRHVTFVSELPKTATGKIQRFKLRAQ